MTYEEALKLIPEVSFVKFAGSNYRFAGLSGSLPKTHLSIYDEPPSDHIDVVNISSCGIVTPSQEGDKAPIDAGRLPTGEDVKRWYQIFVGVDEVAMQNDIIRTWKQRIPDAGMEKIILQNQVAIMEALWRMNTNYTHVAEELKNRITVTKREM